MRVPEALDALKVECERVSEAALELSEDQFGLATRCTAWNVDARVIRTIPAILLSDDSGAREEWVLRKVAQRPLTRVNPAQ